MITICNVIVVVYTKVKKIDIEKDIIPSSVSLIYQQHHDNTIRHAINNWNRFHHHCHFFSSQVILL